MLMLREMCQEVLEAKKTQKNTFAHKYVLCPIPIHKT